MTKTAKECLEPIVNAAYRAGKQGDHPNNANLHKVVESPQRARSYHKPAGDRPHPMERIKSNA